MLYPRAGTLGGCTAHNAMILVCPHDADWDDDRRAHRRCVLVAPPACAATSAGSRTAATVRSSAALGDFGIDRTGHGWDGWLQTEKALPRGAFRDRELMRDDRALGRGRAPRERPRRSQRLRWFLQSAGDPNDATSSRATPRASATRR